ncbi:MAG: ATP-binding protein [Nitrospirae bacterium]|nr:ATP-binding protein [Nitrospirota bacterium]
MIRPSGRVSGSLAGKLVISITVFLLLGGGISWYLLISSGKKNLTRGAIDDASSYSDVVKKSTRYSMLTFHRDAIQETIQEIGKRKEIEGMRLFDGRGKVFYSADRREIGRVADPAALACAGCHSSAGNPAVMLPGERQWSIKDRGEGGRVLTFIDPIYNEPSCASASCHAHSEDRKVLGILQTDFSLAPVDAAIRRQTLHMTLYAVAFMAAGAVGLYFVLRKFVLKPVSQISEAMEKVARGDLEQEVSPPSADEIGQLAGTFNMMAKDLAVAREKMEDWTKALEEGIAEKTEELKESRDRLIQAEKLASLGRLTADVAHEIRNPLTALGGFARRLHKIAAGPKEKEYAEIVLTEVDRLEKILGDVLTFSREARNNLGTYDLEDVVLGTLKLYEDLCREQSVTVENERDEQLFPVLIDPDQVRHALGSLITNALDAMPEGGALTVKTGKEERNGVLYMFLRVSDTGPGIPEEHLPLIFEPFFTTRTATHGTGLGLSITRKIMEEHGGLIRAGNRPGGGSSFTLYFPYQQGEQSPEVKCWEYMKCGRDNDASLKCPAYPNFGRICWAVAGTFCEGRAQGTFAQKYEDCKKCEFYRKVRNGGQQGEHRLPAR